MRNHYKVIANTTTVDAGDAGFSPQVIHQEFETKYEAIKWAWLVVKHRNDVLNLEYDLSNVEFVYITSLDDDDDFYFDATAETDELVFIAALAKERPQAPFAPIDEN